MVRSFSLEPYFQDKMHAATLDLVDNEEKRAKVSNTALLIRKLLVNAFIGIPFNMVDAAGSLVCIRRIEAILNTPEEVSGQEETPLLQYEREKTSHLQANQAAERLFKME